MLSVRPKVAELVFQVFGRGLHPELFEVFATRTLCRSENNVATVQITNTGHVVTWKCRGITITEVAAAAHQMLPKRRRLMNYKLKGNRQDRLTTKGGCRYQTSFQLDTAVDPSVFWSFHNELSSGGERAGLLHKFEASGRINLGALSYINVEARQKSLLVQAFHTFPDDYAIVKSQSLFEMP